MSKTIQSWMKLPYLVAGITGVVLLLCLLSTSAIQAQDSTPTPSAPTNVTADEVNTIARELWCPLCSGVRLDACELKACEQMKDMIAVKLSEGEDLDSIRTYFVAQYGPQVLGEPPWGGFNWVAWVLPFVVLAVGGYFLWNTVRRMVGATSAAVTTAGTSGGTTTAPTKDENGSEDEYERKLAEELKRYG